MERREAIALLQNLKGGVKKYDEALKMAVEALKRQEKYRWHDLRKNPEDFPENEKPVEVAYYSEYTKGFYTARAFHEDGTMHSEETMMSCTDYCSWSDWCEYCEETDDWIIPEGWLEYVTFGEEYAMIDKEVVAWREIEPFEVET